LQHAEWFRHLDPDGRIPFPDGFFDLVACISVMEHVTEPQTFLSEVGRVLRPGGYFVGHSISGSHYVTWIRRAFGLLPHSFNQSLVRLLYGRPEVDTFPAFYRLNRLEAILRAAQPNDLIEVRLRRYADPNYFSFWPPLIPLAVVADWLLEKLASGWGRLYFTITLRNMHDP
jgi:SAM-dependent methyltransferase